jgi:SAM-dependent methyltransferase
MQHSGQMRRSTSGIDGASDRWAEGLDEEIEFWFRWLRDRGAPWTDDYVWRNNPDAPLQPRVRAYLPDEDAHLRILDVGSGPLTILGKRWGDRTLDITAADPLADRYAVLFDRLGLKPPSLPVKADAEHLAEVFDEGTFDLAYARNCLDHGHDPLRAIQQMLNVVKAERYVLLDHATDEGEYMRYSGPHQWNFRVEDGRFVIWRPGLRVDAHSVLEQVADVETAIAPDDSRYMTVALRKRASRRWRRMLDRFGARRR